MFSADAELQIRTCFAPTFRRNANKITDTIDIDRDEWIARDNSLRKIIGEESAGIVAAHAERCLR